MTVKQQTASKYQGQGKIMAEVINVKGSFQFQVHIYSECILLTFRFNLMFISCRQKPIAKLINSRKMAVCDIKLFPFSLNIRHIEKYLR
jgi:hypothetical protein